MSNLAGMATHVSIERDWVTFMHIIKDYLIEIFTNLKKKQTTNSFIIKEF